MDKILNQRPGKALFPGLPGNTSFYQDPDKIHKTAQRNHLNLLQRFTVDGASDLESRLLRQFIVGAETMNRLSFTAPVVRGAGLTFG